ncbi:vitamin K epoxide reductase family protein [Kineococcus auxinigenes]|uniref:vitamin K epoxide reductase family protein n=1 Tax=unclassified Kineococcus TaxID=2621656 RepID=UPI003D7D806F
MAGTTAATRQHGHDDDHDREREHDDEQHLSHLPVSPRARGLLLLLGGAIGLLASMVLTVDRFRLAADPGYRPSCDLNPFISCGTVMTSPQAELFGFPNPLLGIAAFAVTATLGALLLSGTVLPRWVERALLAGLALGMVFVGWLVVAALFTIHALCPYCMVVWVVVTATFWVSLADGLDRGLLPVPRPLRGVARAVVDYRVLLTVLTIAAIAALVGVAFWDYWATLL